MRKVPHFTTLQKVEAKLLNDQHANAMLTQTIALFFDLPQASDGDRRVVQPVEQVAADSTGFELDRASRYFTRRKRSAAKALENKDQTRSKRVTYRRFAKLGIVVCCVSHLVLSMQRGLGPRPDVDQMLPLMNNFVPNVLPQQLLADAGYPRLPPELTVK